MLKRLSIANKLFFAFLALTIVAIAATSAISFKQSRDSLKEAAFEQLTSVREMKAFQIEDYLWFISNQVVTFSSDQMVIDTMRGMASAFHVIESELAPIAQEISKIDADQEAYYEQEFLTRLAPNLLDVPDVGDYLPDALNTKLLQHLYVSGNPYETGSKDFLNDAGDGSTYSSIHRETHPIFREYLQKFGYYDIFLLGANRGDILYTVFKEVDFGTSLLDGPYANTALAKVFEAASRAEFPGFVAIADFEPYRPSYDRPAAFIASPIFDGDKKIGVLAFQMPIDRINKIMTSNQSWTDVGLGESGETYIVAGDYRLRTQSRFLIEDSENYFKMIERMGTPRARIEQIRNLNSSIGLQEVRTEGTEAALAGQSDTRIFDDYRGVSVLSSFKPLDIEGLDWVIMSEIDEAEAFAAIRELAEKLLLTVALMLVLAFVAAMVFSRTITRPLARLSENSNALARGNLEIQIDTSGRDEIGDLSRDFDNMRRSLKKVVGELEDLNVGLERKVAERTVKLESSERRVKSILNNAADGIVVIDGAGTIQMFNPSAESMFGYSADEIVGDNIRLLMPAHLARDHDAHLERYRETGKRTIIGNTREVVGQKRDGAQFPVDLRVGEAEIGGKTIFVGIIRDITERKELEAEVEQANKRMLAELNFAREIQMGMLPLLFPAFPERQELTLDAVLEPAREVGGDFYDFYFLDKNRICLVVGDVSGKGAPAALYMAVSKTLIKSRSAHDFDPSSILTQVNGELAESNTTSTFVTVFTAILDVSTGSLSYCNAGHNPPYIKRKSGKLEQLDELHGPILGVLPDLTYSKDKNLLAPGDMLLIYTDGVTEAMNEKEEEYSDQRLADLLLGSGAQIPNEVTVDIIEDIRRHQGNAEQSDDITLLAVMYNGAEPDEDTHLEVQIKNQMPEMAVVEEKFQEYAERIGVPDADRQSMNMVLDDLLNNVISYAYPEGGDHVILVDVTLRGSRLVLMIEDDGIPFNPFAEQEPDTEKPLEEREIGGLGIQLVRKTMDEYHYQRRANKNVVLVVKELGAMNKQKA